MDEPFERIEQRFADIERRLAEMEAKPVARMDPLALAMESKFEEMSADLHRAVVAHTRLQLQCITMLVFIMFTATQIFG